MLIHLPSDNCAKCRASIWGKQVQYVRSKMLNNGCLTTYSCKCGAEWTMYWPEMGRLARRVKNYLKLIR